MQEESEETQQPQISAPPTTDPAMGRVQKRKCKKCGEKLPLNDFPNHGGGRKGVICKPCKNEFNKKRRQTNAAARLRHYIVTRIKNEAGKHDMPVPADIHTNLEAYVGYKLYELKRALRQDIQDREGITLVRSFKEGYHLDHKRPHSSFAIKSIGDAEFRKCWAIDNLWMIPGAENLKKSDKTDYFDEKGEENE